MSGPALLAGLLLAAALLVLDPSAGARLRRTLPSGPPGAGPGAALSTAGAAAGAAAPGASDTPSRRTGWRCVLPRPVRPEETGLRVLVEHAATLLRAGLGPPAVWLHLIDVADATSPAAGRAARTIAAGGDPAQALRAETSAAPRGQHLAGAPDLRAVAAAWEVADRCGAPLAQVLDRYARALGAEQDAADARAVALAGPRATSRVLVALPLAGIALGVVLGADPVEVLLQTPAGRWCAVGGAALTLLGWWWSRRLVASATSA